MLDIDECGTRNAGHVKTHMAVKPAILYGDDSVFQLGRDALDRDVIRTIDACFDCTTDEKKARSLLGNIGFMYLMQLVCRLLPVGCGEEIADALPYLRKKDEDCSCTEKAAE